MREFIRRIARAALLTASVALFASSASAQQTTDTGSVTLQGSVSGYVEIRAGGAATLVNNSGGGITNNKTKGQSLNNPTTLTIDFGDVGPSNTASFVIATVPLRLRSNVSYTLKMSAAPITYGSGTPDADSVTLADIGFGVISAIRDTTGGVASGTDTIAAAASGDPASPANGSINAAGRYVYNAGHSLSSYTTISTILSGPRIMNAVVPVGNTNGLVVNTVFALKPQFFTPGSFSTTVTFTISNP